MIRQHADPDPMPRGTLHGDQAAAARRSETTGLYLWVARRGTLLAQAGSFRLGAWERPVVAGALGWLGIELVILLAPARFRPAQGYALGAVAVGLVVYALLRLAEPAAMTSQPPSQNPPADPGGTSGVTSAGERPLW